jgi:beta-lactamase regulating signal transducer with metallopeptidase domain
MQDSVLGLGEQAVQTTAQLSGSNEIHSRNAEFVHAIVGLKASAMSIWLVGCTVVLIVFVGNFLFVRRRILKTVVRIDDVESGVQFVLSQLESGLSLERGQVRLLVSDESFGPLVFGFLRPTIVLPSSMVNGSTQLRPIIAHELCHIWRRDHLLGVLQIAVQVVLWFHPLVWVASRKVNRLCEVCCDDDAMRLFELDSKSYAQGLIDVLSMQNELQPLAMSPGIRAVEVTKQRLKKIIVNRRPRNRQNHVICVCVFLCLIVPSFTSGSRNAGPIYASTESTGQETQKRSALTIAEVAQRRTEMDFLLGSWDVVSAKGERTGHSVFAYEKSGKMIREDWTAESGETAQGITFYDPNEACWKMTWVDSHGTIMESSGQWNDESLTLTGWITSKDGARRKAQTALSKVPDGTIRLTMNVDIKGRLRPVSSSIYRPAK